MDESSELKALFEKAEKDLSEAAKKHGFTVKLISDRNGTMYFHPQVPHEYVLSKVGKTRKTT